MNTIVSEECSEYELLQRKNIEERNKILQLLQIDDTLKDFKPLSKEIQPKKPKRPRVETVLPKREPSRRIRSLAADKINPTYSPPKPDISEEEVDERLKGTISLTDDEVPNILQNLRCLDNDADAIFDPNIDLNSCSIESFRNNLVCLRFVGPYRVTSKRIQSLCVHPTISKQIILAGCASGSLGLWDVNADAPSNVVQFSYHKAPLNCITVSQFNQHKVFTTSHDGSICCVDIEQKQCSNIFSTDFDESVKHLTWHEEINSNTLLLAHGNGNVGILDLREKTNDIPWIDCFPRSCRTVHLSPADPEYFLTSSGLLGEGCKIYDLRSTSKEVSHLPHPKGLTSAFFSPNGNSILTTCNDDRLYIFNSSSFKTTEPKIFKSIVHNNHTGRWLSVFKATWFPYRNDAFFIGCLSLPRKIQIFESTGSVLHECMHEEMATISSVVATHPKLPMLAGANSTGKRMVISYCTIYSPIPSCANDKKLCMMADNNYIDK